MNREVPEEAEALPVKPRSHEGEKKRARARERHDADSEFVRALNDLRSRVGDAGAPRLGNNPGASSFNDGREPGVDFPCLRIVPDLLNGESRNGLGMSHALQCPPGRPGSFNEEVVERPRDLERALRNGFRWRTRADRTGNEVERSGHENTPLSEGEERLPGESRADGSAFKNPG